MSHSVADIVNHREYLITAINSAYRNFHNFRYIINDIEQNKKCDYLTFSIDDSDRVSYAPSEETQSNYDRRIKTKLGRYLRRKFETELNNFGCTDEQLEEFVKAIMRFAPIQEEKFEVITGKDIVKAYNNCIGCSSCMTGGNEAVTLYGENDNVRMLIYRHHITARALLWTCDDGKIVLDRIYPNSGNHIGVIHEYCEKQSWAYRVKQGMPCDGIVKLSDGSVRQITLQSSCGLWPYMDTFRYAVGDEYSCTVSNDYDNDYDAVLESTCGTFSDERETCVHCESRTRNYRHTENGYVCEDCINDNYVYSNVSGNYIESEDAVELIDSETYVSYDYACGHYYQCVRCENWHAYSDSVRDFEGEYYCSNCLEDIAVCCRECGTLLSIDNNTKDMCDMCYETANSESEG